MSNCLNSIRLDDVRHTVHDVQPRAEQCDCGEIAISRTTTPRIKHSELQEQLDLVDLLEGEARWR